MGWRCLRACKKDTGILADCKHNVIQMRGRVTNKTDLFKIEVLKGKNQNLTLWCGASHNFISFYLPSNVKRVRFVLWGMGKLEKSIRSLERRKSLCLSCQNLNGLTGAVRSYCVEMCSSRGLPVIICLDVFKDLHSVLIRCGRSGRVKNEPEMFLPSRHSQLYNALHSKVHGY